MERVMAFLHTGGPLPARYTQYVLCSKIYHCPPSELDNIPMGVIAADWTCYIAELKVRAASG